MRYKKIIASTNKGDMYVDEFRYSKSLKFKTIRGESVLDEDIPEVFIKNKTGKFSDFIYGSAHPVISDKFKKVLESLEQENLEFLPVKIHNYNTDKSFWLMNMIGLIKCMDWERSEFIIRDDQINKNKPYEIEHLVLNAEALTGVHIFRMYERSVDLYISDYLEDLLVKNDIKGYSVSEVDS